MAAAAAAATAAAMAATAAAMAASAAAMAATAAACYLEAALSRRRVLLVEDIKRRKADVGDFLVTESDFVTR